MKFLLDESAEARIAAFLAGVGHDAARIGRDHPAGLNDRQVLDIAHRERRILVANDKDFGELVVRFGRPHAGVILFRFPLDATADEKIEALRRLLASDLPFGERLVVLSPKASASADGIGIGIPNAWTRAPATRRCSPATCRRRPERRPMTRSRDAHRRRALATSTPLRSRPAAEPAGGPGRRRR